MSVNCQVELAERLEDLGVIKALYLGQPDIKNRFELRYGERTARKVTRVQ